jgi:signal transduction histidine kinase
MELSHVSGATIAAQAAREEQRFFLGRSLFWLRWTILAAMLVITVIWPFAGRGGAPLWRLMLVFIGYNLVVELLRWHVPRLHGWTWVPIPDLLVAGTIYFFDHEPGGPTFVTFYLALLTAAATMTLRATILYTVAVVAIIAALAPTLPQWSTNPADLRQLSARLVILALVGIGTAILTRRLSLEQEEARAMRDEVERLEELDRLRNEFIASVSHDLRTPLTAARAGLGMLEASLVDRLRPDEQHLLGNVRRNTGRLKLLIDDLLALNQLEAGAITLDREPLDLRTVVADALSSVYSLVQGKQQTLEVDLPEPLPCLGDARRLEQVVVNVISNAHQHTPPQTRIRISGTVASGDVHLAVCDDGPGIPTTELEAIFQRFHRLPAADNGSGLGLAIAQALVELHGGRIWAESQPGQGATFHVTLPRYQDGDYL